MHSEPGVRQMASSSDGYTSSNQAHPRPAARGQASRSAREQRRTQANAFSRTRARGIGSDVTWTNGYHLDRCVLQPRLLPLQTIPCGRVPLVRGREVSPATCKESPDRVPSGHPYPTTCAARSGPLRAMLRTGSGRRNSSRILASKVAGLQRAGHAGMRGRRARRELQPSLMARLQ